MQAKEENWDLVIESKSKFLPLNLGELWRYRDLLMMFVKRDLTAQYKQTLLGPLWFFLQPVFTTLVYYFMFGRIANISTDGKPALLFYMGGLVCWNFFADCVNGTNNVFVSNAYLFGKVYFPRLVVPFSTIISASLKFFIQFLLFMLTWCYYAIVRQSPDVHLTWNVLILPLLLINIAFLGLGIGVIVSAVTTKYRDLRNLLGYAMQFGLYATPIIFPLEWMKKTIPMFYKICLLNPMTGIVEAFKYSFFGSGIFSWSMLAYSFGFTLVLLFMAVFMFNRVEKTFVDTV
jgi:lipopolysaccharide transport system permease protein